MTRNNIFPERDEFINRHKKEGLLGQNGKVIWFTGLSGSGKSTLAQSVELELAKHELLTEVLDGDKIRNGLNKDLGFSNKDRIENIRRIAEVSKLFCNAGLITISAFISPTNAIRQMAREIIGDNDFIEVFLSTPISVCEQRDTKGLYKKARQGLIKDFTGISSPFESPINPDIELNTDNLSVEYCTREIVNLVSNKVKLSSNVA